MTEAQEILPEPMTPPESDVRKFSYMPLDVVRLRDSEMACLESGEAFRCGVLLWSASWHQIPAASLPDDETALARLAGYGRGSAAIKAFRQARAEGGMRGWILCRDGRWYHPVVAEKANDAIASSERQKQRTLNATKTRRGATDKRDDEPKPDMQTTSRASSYQRDGERDGARDHNVTTTVTSDVTFTKERKGKESKGKEKESLAAGTPNSRETATDPVSPSPRSATGHAVQVGPKPGSPPEEWAHLAEEWEVQRSTGIRRPVRNGEYVDLLAGLCLEAGRMNPESFSGDWRPMIAWLDDKIDGGPIVAAIHEVASRANYKPPTSLRYFDQAVRERRAAA
jgi:hypothetical protein